MLKRQKPSGFFAFKKKNLTSANVRLNIFNFNEQFVFAFLPIWFCFLFCQRKK